MSEQVSESHLRLTSRHTEDFSSSSSSTSTADSLDVQWFQCHSSSSSFSRTIPLTLSGLVSRGEKVEKVEMVARLIRR